MGTDVFPSLSTRTRPSLRTSGDSSFCNTAPTSLMSWGTRPFPRKISKSPMDGTGKVRGQWSLRGGEAGA